MDNIYLTNLLNNGIPIIIKGITILIIIILVISHNILMKNYFRLLNMVKVLKKITYYS